MPFARAAPTLGDRRVLAAAGVGVGVLAAVAIFASLGGPQGPLDGLAWVMILLARAGAAPAAYILAGAGLGRLIRPLFRGARDEWALQLAVGIALMLSLSHALGMFRLLGGPTGHIVAIGVVVAGLALLAHQLFAGGALQNASMVLPLTSLPGFVGVALMVVAAASPPGWLWDSEFGGFDALEYHLQLPQEWLARGWLWPVEHNVYSYLPSYVESAYMHLGAFLGGQAAPSAAAPMTGLLAGDGSGVLACQLLHVGLTVCAGVLVGRATRVAAERCGLSARASSAGAGLAASLYLLTPWNIVVGSLAYNEAGMTALGAGALLAAVDNRLSPARRGMLAGLLVGVACGAKPTALTLIGAPVGIALLALAPRREWGRLVGAGAVAGIAALAPWLVRNWYACGNPVFPFAASLFGAAHWTPEQIARYAAGHSFHGPVVDRVSLLFLPDPGGPSGRPTHRGLMHPQWFVFFPACALSAIVAVWRPPTRRIGTILAVGIVAQVALWMFTTHVQSRFLIPVGVTGCIAFGLAAAALGREGVLPGVSKPGRSARPAAPMTLVAVLIVAAQGAAAVVNFAGQRGGHPNDLLVDHLDGRAGGVGSLTGEAARGLLTRASPDERRKILDSLPPTLFVNLAVPPGATIYLLGDSAALYYRFPLRHHTTWDTSLLGLAIGADPSNPGGWTTRLRAAGIDLVLVNFAELDRLGRAGWYDPRVTPGMVRDWLLHYGAIIHQWPQTGQALFSIAPGRTAPGPDGGTP